MENVFHVRGVPAAVAGPVFASVSSMMASGEEAMSATVERYRAVRQELAVAPVLLQATKDRGASEANFEVLEARYCPVHSCAGGHLAIRRLRQRERGTFLARMFPVVPSDQY